MKTIFLIGVALVIGGAAVLSYDHYSYTTRENILQIGPIIATADETHTISFPPIIGWLLVGGGICVLVFGALSKKS